MPHGQPGAAHRAAEAKPTADDERQGQEDRGECEHVNRRRSVGDPPTVFNPSFHSLAAFHLAERDNVTAYKNIEGVPSASFFLLYLVLSALARCCTTPREAK